MDIETTTVLGTLLRRAPLPEYCGTVYGGDMESGAHVQVAQRPWRAGSDDEWFATVTLGERKRVVAYGVGRTLAEAAEALHGDVIRSMWIATRRPA